ncbi:hypothetical protein [Elizabethkingia ursingii]|nr:hypothetical protein [Elizabethkingia ursingii]
MNELKVNPLKREYLAPMIEVEFLEIEQGIAAGSAPTIPPNMGGKVNQEWETIPDETHEVEWP